MDLWIRSQDRKVLKKVNQLYVATYSEEIGYGIYDLSYYDMEDLDDCDIPLGFYKTKERTLEVLDEIQDYIENRCSTKLINDVNSITYETITRGNVYKMPMD